MPVFWRNILLTSSGLKWKVWVVEVFYKVEEGRLREWANQRQVIGREGPDQLGVFKQVTEGGGGCWVWCGERRKERNDPPMGIMLVRTYVLCFIWTCCRHNQGRSDKNGWNALFWKQWIERLYQVTRTEKQRNNGLYQDLKNRKHCY
jgi:hypothetical protein